MEQKGLLFVARCAACLPVLWLALFLLALPFPGGHPSLPSLVAVVPVSLSLTGRAAGSLMGEPGAFAISLPVLVLATLVELAFVGAVAGVAARRLFDGHFPGQSAWLGCFRHLRRMPRIRWCASHLQSCHQFVLSVGSPGVRHEVLKRIAKSGDRSYRETLLSALEKESEPDVDEDIIGALTLLEDGAFWHGYLTSPRGSRWGMSTWAKVLCDISNKSLYLRQVPGVDFALLTESFADLNRRMFDRMVAALPDRPELLKPVFRIAFNNPTLGRALVDRLFDLLQRPSIAKCVHLGFSYRSEWSDASHPKHRLYKLANATCQDFTKARPRVVADSLRLTRRIGTIAAQCHAGCASSSSTLKAWTGRGALVDKEHRSVIPCSSRLRSFDLRPSYKRCVSRAACPSRGEATNR